MNPEIILAYVRERESNLRATDHERARRLGHLGHLAAERRALPESLLRAELGERSYKVLCLLHMLKGLSVELAAAEQARLAFLAVRAGLLRPSLRDRLGTPSQLLAHEPDYRWLACLPALLRDESPLLPDSPSGRSELSRRISRFGKFVPTQLLDLRAALEPRLSPDRLGALSRSVETGDGAVLASCAITKTPCRCSSEVAGSVGPWALELSVPLTLQSAGPVGGSSKLVARKDLLPLLQHLLKRLGNAEPVGSWRRGAERLGDLDILVKEPRTARAAREEPKFALPAPAKWLRGAQPPADSPAAPLNLRGGVSVLYSLKPPFDGSTGGRLVQVDIWSAPSSTYAYALLHLTGSKGHNIGLRSLAKKQGMLLNQYGLFRKRAGAVERVLPAARTEQAIFRQLGKKYKVPHLRN